MAPNTTSTSPNDNLQIPKWINEEYFHKILDKDEPNYTKIINFKTVAATAPGENYTSIMVRVKIDVELKDGSKKQKSYILKTTLECDGTSAQMLSNMNLFPKEKQMYQVILPQFERLYQEAGWNIKFGPKCHQVDDTPERITLVMEDLGLKQFKNADRIKGFNMEHITQVLKRIAEFHAVSLKYHELNGEYDDIFQRGFFTEESRPIFEAMAKNREISYKKAMREWGLENVEHYIATIPKPSEGFDEAIRIDKSDPNEFNVLNHGDCWANNIMFNYNDNGSVNEALFVDFQVGRWGTPAQDLWYMIITSAALDIKVKEFDHFVYIYHKRLIECMDVLKCTKQQPTLKELHIMMLKYGYWGIITANGVMSVVLLPSDKDANMDNLLKMDAVGDEFRYKVYTNPLYAKAMCQLFPFFENKGILGAAKK